MIEESDEDVPAALDCCDYPPSFIERDVQVHVLALSPQTLHECNVAIMALLLDRHRATEMDLVRSHRDARPLYSVAKG
jgi:hypothetical protein